MKILIVTNEFVTEATRFGGLANYSAKQARMLNEAGCDVEVVVVSDETEVIVWENGIKVHRVNCYEKRDSITNRMKSLMFRTIYGSNKRYSRIINNYIKRKIDLKDVDVIHYSSSGALAYYRVKDKPCVVRLSSYMPVWRAALKEDFNLETTYYPVDKMDKLIMESVKKGDKVFAPSRVIADITSEVTGVHVDVIESPFDLQANEITELDYVDDIGSPYFLFYGTLNLLKGIKVIGEAIYDILKRYEDYKFVFIGYDDNVTIDKKVMKASEYIRRMAHEYADRVVIYEPISDKRKLYAIVKNACCCVLPSRIDNLPNTCIESMSLGQIVIGTRGASFDQLIDDGVNGFLIDRDNVSQCVKTIEYVVNMPVIKRQDIQDEAKATIIRLTPSIIGKQLKDYYRLIK